MTQKRGENFSESRALSWRILLIGWSYVNAVGRNGTDRDKFASQRDGIRFQWDDVVPRNFVATFLGTESLPPHAVKIHSNRRTQSWGTLHSKNRRIPTIAISHPGNAPM